MDKKETVKMSESMDERGGALVMALLVSFLLLVASAGLLLEASMNTANVTDAVAELQAYNAAESGIQSAVNVLRGNVAPSPLLDSSKPATDPANKINFIKALNLSTSNLSSDTSGAARLSRWMSYDYTPSGAAFGQRVTVGAPGSGYDPLNGYAYSLSIADPDNTGSIVSFYTTGRMFDADAGYTDRRTYGSGANTVKIQYYPNVVNSLNVGSGAAATNIGKFVVTVSGTGASIPAFNRFEIIENMTVPYHAYRIMRGYIETGTINSTSSNVKIIIDSVTFTLMGSVMTINFNGGGFVYHPELNPKRVGFEAPLNIGDNVLGATISAAEPTRLLVKSTGYGPRGAMKQLEAIIQKNFFNGLTAPATLALIGPTSTAVPATSFFFDPGSSNVTTYSGDDVVSTDFIPPIGTTTDLNLATVEDSVNGQPPHPFNGDVIGTPANISPELPEWLQSPLKLDSAIQQLYGVAAGAGRYYGPGQNPPNFGNNATGQGITFVDHDATFTGAGGGILVVTGQLTLHGNFNFNGLIIVTGKDGVIRKGGGNGTLQGNVVVAPYLKCQISDGQSPTAAETFLSPFYDLSGGGNSTITYNSSSTANGLLAISNFVLGVAEK